MVIQDTSTVQPSLTGGASKYMVVQLRSTSPGSVRVQWHEQESNFTVSPELTTWLSKCKADRKSLAGSNAMYIPALARRESPTDVNKVRFQIMGPKLNREWGAVFIAYAPTAWAALGGVK